MFWEKNFSRNTAWAKNGLYHTMYGHDDILAPLSLDKDDTNMYSRLSEFGTWRRNDGLFHLKMCWPASELGCIEWFQEHDPVNELWTRDPGLVVLSNPFEETAPFHGLTRSWHQQTLFDGQLGDEDQGLFNLGQRCMKAAGANCRLAGSLYAADTTTEMDEVELFVRLEEQPSCISCDACFDSDGQFRDGACPSRCTEVKPPRVWDDLNGVHALAIETAGFKAIECPLNSTNTTSPRCHGNVVNVRDELPAQPLYTLGGSRHRALFVAPVTGTYTFRPLFDDQGELWVSTDASPQHASLECNTAAGDGHGGRYLYTTDRKSVV